ncbi:MAG TPA: hypothetical protein VHC43_10100 [Mycobacteriales bacterium]|nr:hypothetical protein [Mycobacteriales bacterium]
MTQQPSTSRGRRGLAANLICVLLSVAALMTAMGTAKATAVTGPVTKARAIGASHTTAKLRDPRRNVAPSPDYLDNCAANGSNNRTCLRQALAAINAARADEGIRPMVLPINYAHMSIVRQTFVVTNLERIARGLRPIKGLTSRLNANARHAANSQEDPSLVGSVMSLLGVRSYGSVWAGDFGPLSSDYDWMYNDGYSAAGSVNLDCRTPSSSGCWGHRHVILGQYSGLRTLIAGVGSSDAAGSSLAEIVVGSVHSSFHYVYTWKQALSYGAAGHKVTAATTNVAAGA